MTPFELDRDGRWYWLRKAVNEQGNDKTVTYLVGKDIRLARMAVMATAKRHNFKVKIKSLPSEESIVVWRGKA